MAWDKISAGKSLPGPLGKADFINGIIDAVADYNVRRLGEPSPTSGLKYPTDLVKVKNLTGGDRQRGDCVQLGNDLLDVKDFRRLWFECDLPADPIMRRYAILIAPLLEDEIGFAQVGGCCLARVNVGNVLHTHAMPADGADEIVSCFGGPIELLSDPDGTGSQEIAVRLAVGFGLLYGKPDGTVTARSGTTAGTGTVSIWQLGLDGEFADSNVNDTLHNFANTTFSSSQFMTMQRENRNGLLAVVNLECAP